MQASWMLARLENETRISQGHADRDRLAPLTASSSPDGYRAFLAGIYGFESPVHSAFQMTVGLDEVIDLRSRTQVRLLRADLTALGVEDLAALPRCKGVLPFHSPVEALGWMYVVERNLLFQGVIRRHLEKRAPEQLQRAGLYVVCNERSAGFRIAELGAALDAIARSSAIADRIVAAAQAGFRCQRNWFARVVPRRAQVA